MIFCRVILFIFIFSAFLSQSLARDPFSFHILTEPVTLDPVRSLGSWNSFVHFNLYRSLYRFDGTKKTSELAERCWQPSPLEWRCRIKKNLKYANGEKIEISHFLTAFQEAFSSTASAKIKSEVLFLKNAKKILDGKALVSELGIKAENNILIFNFDQVDSHFLGRLTSPLFSPRPPNIQNDQKLARDYATGPYRLKKIEPLKSVRLEPNHFYQNGHQNRPEVIALIVNNDATALSLYLKKQLHFLRRVPQDQYSSLLTQPEFKKHIHTQNMIRMDYVGFSGALVQQPELREALTLSLDYKELQDLLKSKGRPGCYSLSTAYYGSPALCYQTNIKKARSLIEKINLEKKNTELQFFYSIQGGEDIQRAVEWMQNQWKKNLGLSIRLNPTENTVLSARLRDSTPDLFRRGVPVDSPSCFAALEGFQTDHPENFLKISNPQIQKGLLLLAQSASEAQRKEKCREVLGRLMIENRMIPLGEIYFVILARPIFTGWKLNELNQLDLSNLRAAQ